MELPHSDNQFRGDVPERAHSRTGLFLRQRLRQVLHKYEGYILGASQVGSRGICTSIEAYWLTHGVHPTHAADVPVKFLTWGLWGFTKYFQWLGVFHLYHRVVPESQTAATYFAVKDKLRRLKNDPIREGVETAKTLISLGIQMGKEAIDVVDGGYEMGDSCYYYAGVNPSFVIRKLEE